MPVWSQPGFSFTRFATFPLPYFLERTEPPLLKARSVAQNMKTVNRGFSLIELLIVVAIILTLAAIAVPNLLRARMAANEASAVGSLRTINTAAVEYNATYGNGYPPALSALGTTGSTALSCTNAELIDSVLTTGTKSGFVVAIVHGATRLTSASSSCSAAYGYSDGYVTTATPVSVGTTGQRAFCSDATGVIRFSASGVAGYTTPNCSSTMTPLQ